MLPAKMPPGLLRLIVSRHKREVEKILAINAGKIETASLTIYSRSEKGLNCTAFTFDVTNMPAGLTEFLRSYADQQAALMNEAALQMNNKIV